MSASAPPTPHVRNVAVHENVREVVEVGEVREAGRGPEGVPQQRKEAGTEQSHQILAYPIVFYPMLPYPMLSYPMLSHAGPILFYPSRSLFQSYAILFFPTLSYPIISYSDM